MEELRYRTIDLGVRAPKADDQGLVTFVASDESEDRLGDILRADGWQLESFKENPVFLYAHDPTFPPIGTVANVRVDGKQLLATVRFDDDDEFAAMVHRKYVQGFMRAVSVGFRAVEFEERIGTEGKKGIVFKKQELVEISAVAVPAHPKALRKALGERGRYWLPYQPDLQVQLADLKGLIADTTREIARIEATLSDQDGVPSGWPDEVLNEIAQLGR